MSNRINAYTEVWAILNSLEKTEYNKIPKEVIEVIRKNKNEEYKFELNDNIELEEHTLLEETKAILFNLFRDYLSTPEQKEKIKKMQQDERQKNELKKKQNWCKGI